MVLQGYWQADVAPTMRAAILADWADELEDWHVDQVRWALRQWRRDNPSKRPNPGHISALLKDRRGKEVAQRIAAERVAARQAIPAPGQHHETADERRVSAERARAIMAEAMAVLRINLAAEEAAVRARRDTARSYDTQRPAPPAEEGAA